MKVSVTGHTSGIGNSIFNYFKNKNYVCQGFSRSTGYNIDLAEDRNKILELSKDSDIFVNNAYSNFNDSQLEVLKLVTNEFFNQDKIIINISSRITERNSSKFLENYRQSKIELDQFCQSHSNMFPWIINLKPGLTDTRRVHQFSGSKIKTEDIINVLDFILENREKYKVTTITFGL